MLLKNHEYTAVQYTLKQIGNKQWIRNLGRGPDGLFDGTDDTFRISTD